MLLDELLSDLDHIPFHSLERLRGKLISILIVCPLAKLYIREMNRVLAAAELTLTPVLKADTALELELRHWKNNPIMLDHENDLHRTGEMDIIPSKYDDEHADAEHMSGKPLPCLPFPNLYHIFLDASNYRVGTYDCQTGETMQRQLSAEEGLTLDIAMKEMLAVKLLVDNLDLSAHPKVIRLHVDNMRCVYGYQQYGCRAQYLNDIVKYLFDWQVKHRIRLEMVYVNTKVNLADAPSRDLDIPNELCITPALFSVIEKRFHITFTLDCCATLGTQITTLSGKKVPFCSQYIEDGSQYTNFFSLPFRILKERDECVWIFGPRRKEATFIDHFLNQKYRPCGVIMVVQHAEQPTLLNLLHRHSTAFQVYRGRRLLQKPKKKLPCFEPYYGHLTLYCFFFPEK